MLRLTAMFLLLLPTLAFAQDSAPVAQAGDNPLDCPFNPLSGGTDFGTTGLSFTVTETGTVTDATITRTSGNDRLDRTGVRCVSHWTFKPGMKNGAAVAQQMNVAINWSFGDRHGHVDMHIPETRAGFRP
jgi:TonB family protein